MNECRLTTRVIRLKHLDRDYLCPNLFSIIPLFKYTDQKISIFYMDSIPKFSTLEKIYVNISSVEMIDHVHIHIELAKS